MPLKLRVQNFRSYDDFTAIFPDNISIITGTNGSGKTSLIEAVYLAYSGKSWRSNFEEILKRDNSSKSDWWRIDIIDQATGENRVIKYQNKQKTFEINGKSFKRLPKVAKRPVILFEPNDMQLLYGSPSRRRQFIDRFIEQIEPIHRVEINKFERVLKQRNNLLKQDNYSKEDLLIWDIQFASLSYEISNRRRQYLTNISKKLSNKYKEISGDNRTINIKFFNGAPLQQGDILNSLNQSLDRLTSIGAQKDDYRFVFDNADAKVAASRGENRSIIFAVIGVVVDLTRQLYGDDVIVLLDDIDSELDKNHRTNLYSMSSWTGLTIATTLEKNNSNYYYLELGR